MQVASGFNVLSGLRAMQLRVTPFLSGYIPVSSIPLCGLLRGHVLTALLSTSDSSAKLSRFGV